MRTYTTISGDMWDSISFKVYGSTIYTGKLMAYNSEYLDENFVFPAGIELQVPELTNADADLSDACFFGELGLDGALRGGNGALCLALAARDSGAKRLFVPRENAAECSVVEGLAVYGAESVSEILDHLTGAAPLTPVVFDRDAAGENGRAAVDFSDIKGQETAKRAAEIAAAGGHNLLLAGPPGSGKSMLAKAIPGILPRMSFEEMLETTKIHSIAGLIREGEGLLRERPCRAPHHTMSFVGLAGGGATPQPGRSAWPTTASSSWTSCRRLKSGAWRSCASPWRIGR